MNKEDIIKIEAPQSKEDLVKLGYLSRTVENHPSILKM